MKRTREDSSLEVWSENYINYPFKRFDEDMDAEVIQIEPGNSDGDYIVEIVRKKGD